MKKLLFIAIIGISSLANAQTGNWYVGGTVGFGATKVGGVKGNAYEIAPELGININETVQIGLGVNFSGSTANSGAANEIKTNTWAPNPYIRKFWSMSDIFSLFAGVYGNFTTGHTDVGGTKTESISGFGGDLVVGAGFHPAERWTILGTYGLFNYSHLKTTNELTNTDVTSNSWALGVNTLGPVFNVGLYYTFIKKD